MRKQANSVTKRLAMYGMSVFSDVAGSYPVETRVGPSTTKKKILAHPSLERQRVEDPCESVYRLTVVKSAVPLHVRRSSSGSQHTGVPIAAPSNMKSPEAEKEEPGKSLRDSEGMLG